MKTIIMLPYRFAHPNLTLHGQKEVERQTPYLRQSLMENERMEAIFSEARLKSFECEVQKDRDSFLGVILAAYHVAAMEEIDRCRKRCIPHKIIFSREKG